MHLGLLYGNFVMDNKNLTLYTTADESIIFRDTDAHTYHHTYHQTIQGCGSRYRKRPVVNKPATFRFWRNRFVWILGGGWTHDGYNLRVSSGLDHMHGIFPADLLHFAQRGSTQDLSLCENSLRPTLIADRHIY